MIYDNEYNNIINEVLIFRDDLNYKLDDVIHILHPFCDVEIITEIFNNSNNVLIKTDVNEYNNIEGSIICV